MIYVFAASVVLAILMVFIMNEEGNSEARFAWGLILLINSTDFIVEMLK